MVGISPSCRLLLQARACGTVVSMQVLVLEEFADFARDETLPFRLASGILLLAWRQEPPASSSPLRRLVRVFYTPLARGGRRGARRGRMVSQHPAPPQPPWC